MDSFFAELSTCKDGELLEFGRRQILHGSPFVFKGREAEYYLFRKRISDKFNIHFNEVIIVGSAKLGFSPHKRSKFDFDSDVDVALISPQLFEAVLGKLLEFQFELRASRRAITEFELGKYHRFLEYTVMGWIRPDMLPVSFQMGQLKQSWFDFFDSISHGKSEVGNYKVSGGVWKTYNHIERYTTEMLTRVRLSAEVEMSRG